MEFKDNIIFFKDLYKGRRDEGKNGWYEVQYKCNIF